jgi:sigma-B regulation protein RsbU (phosphoserine phosphatase)
VSRLRQFADRLGKSGVAFLVLAPLALLFYLAGWRGLLFLTLVALFPLGSYLAFRLIRYVMRNSLWSLRNRLLFVYGLIGVLPMALILVLVGIGSWAFLVELALYLARTELDHRTGAVQFAVERLHSIPLEQRSAGAVEIVRSFRGFVPGLTFELNDGSGAHRYPPGSAVPEIPVAWPDRNGLVYDGGEFYDVSHFHDSSGSITGIAPLSTETVSNLVPHLGVIALFEGIGADDNGSKNSDPKFAGLFQKDRIPPPENRLDVTLSWASTVPHYDLNNPNRIHSAGLLVETRPSAVMRAFFSGKEMARGFLMQAFIGIGILFLFVECVAVLLGVALARRMTNSVNQLYNGTRSVIQGDFSNRIPVRTNDQLGDLGRSFNQMTGTLERLLAVEKEKERMQTELEIAREVQGQLYPKEAPPACGLRLTVRCDPARMVSGDYYDYQVVGHQRLAFAIGDVAGKGISAALLMATLQAALRAQLNGNLPHHENECSVTQEIDCSALITQLNKQIFATTAPEKYATFFFALWDEGNCTLTYTNAGHLSPLLIQNGEVTPLDSNGLVIGAIASAQYNESCIAIHPGDLLVCYTDGITEPENAYGEMFGEERLIDLVKKHAHQDESDIVRIVMDAVRSWTGSPELFDDMTLLLARQVTTVAAA